MIPKMQLYETSPSPTQILVYFNFSSSSSLINFDSVSSLQLSDFLTIPMSREQSMISCSSKNFESLFRIASSLFLSSSFRQSGYLFLKSLSFFVARGSESNVSLPCHDPLMSYLSDIFSRVLKTLAMMTKQLLPVSCPLSFLSMSLWRPKNLVMRVSGFCFI